MKDVRVKRLAVIWTIVLCIASGLNTPVSALNSPDITWKDSPLSPLTSYDVNLLASTNSTGLKKWSVAGSCALKSGIVTTKSSGYCTVKLSLKPKGNFSSKTSTRRFSIESQNYVASLPAAFSMKTTRNGLGSDQVNDVFVNGQAIYVATDKGLSISVDGGRTFTNRTSSSGIGNGTREEVNAVFVSGFTVYAGTFTGLSISTDGGISFTNRTLANGIGSNIVYDVFMSGQTIYVATDNGLSISVDGGATFINRSSRNGLGGIGGWNVVEKVYVVGSTIYAAIYGGISISTDGGTTFTNRTSKNGLGFCCNAIHVSGTTVYVGGIGGLYISKDMGKTFKQPYKKYSWNHIIYDLVVIGNTIYAASYSDDESCRQCGGVSVSSDGGTTFKTYNFNTSNGLENTEASSVFIFDGKVFAGQRSYMSGFSPGGLAISD